MGGCEAWEGDGVGVRVVVGEEGELGLVEKNVVGRRALVRC